MNSTHATVAKLIKKELKANFPSVKFRVKSSSFSGGNSVDIHWENGVTVKQVENIVDKYESGHFNGMEDIYEFKDTNYWVNEEGKIERIPTVKYVMTDRKITDDVYAVISDAVALNYKCDDNDYWFNHKVRESLFELDLTATTVDEYVKTI